jgi:SAM-dependent methyltransferase
VKLTGERPVQGETPDSLLALHDAGYREVVERLGAGKVLDLGCGVGFETAKFVAPDRQVFGADYDAETARIAGKHDGLLTACMDGARLGFRTGAFDWVCSSHLIEHFRDPSTHAAEISRVTAARGTAFIVTPNRPADFENPYHVALVDDRELADLLRPHFDDVTVYGLDATPTVKADFEARRRTGAKVLRFDVFDLRHKIPHRWYVGAYSIALRVMYRLLKNRYAGGSTGISAGDFFVTETIDETTLVLLAVARAPGHARPTG